MVARLELFSPNTTGIDPAILSEFTDGNLIDLTELGGLTNNGFEDGTQSLSKEAKQPRLYTVQGVTTREQYALVNYYKQLQNNGDPNQPLAAQEGLIYCRDYYYEIDELELRYQRVATGDSTTTTVSGRTIRCGFQFPCYLLFGEQIKNVLGRYYGEISSIAESAEFAILERVDLLPSEITTQLSGTIRIAYASEFSVDFTKLANPYARRPVDAPEITTSLFQNPGIERLVGDYKQEWILQAELTLDQLRGLHSINARWRSNGGDITLSDLTHVLVESLPRTRLIASGAEDISNGVTRYFASFNVGQHQAIEINPKEGDSQHVIVNCTYRELEASQP